MIHFGEKLKEFAEKQGISASELASKLGKTAKAVYDDLGKADLSTSVLRQYAQIFNLELEDLFRESAAYPVKSPEKYLVKEDELEYLRKEGKNCENCTFARQLFKIIHHQNEHISSLTQTLNNLTNK